MKLVLIALQLSFTLVVTETNPSSILSSDVGKTNTDETLISDNEGVKSVDVSNMSEEDKILKNDDDKGNEQEDVDTEEKADQDLENMAFDDNENDNVLGLESGNALLISPIIGDHDDDTAHDDPQKDKIIKPKEDNQDAFSGHTGDNVKDKLDFDDFLNADEENDDGDDNTDIDKDKYKNDHANVALDDFLKDDEEANGFDDYAKAFEDNNDDVMNTIEKRDQNRSDIQAGVVFDEYVNYEEYNNTEIENIGKDFNDTKSLSANTNNNYLKADDDNDDDVKNMNYENDKKGDVYNASAFYDYLNDNEDNDDGIEHIDKDENKIIGIADSIAFDDYAKANEDSNYEVKNQDIDDDRRNYLKDGESTIKYIENNGSGSNDTEKLSANIDNDNDRDGKDIEGNMAMDDYLKDTEQTAHDFNDTKTHPVSMDHESHPNGDSVKDGIAFNDYSKADKNNGSNTDDAQDSITVYNYHDANYYDVDNMANDEDQNEVDVNKNLTFDDYLKADEESNTDLENINKDDDQNGDEVVENKSFDDDLKDDENNDTYADISEPIFNTFSNSIESTDTNYNGNVSNDAEYNNDQYEDGVQDSEGSNEYVHDDSNTVSGGITRTFHIANSEIMMTRSIILPLEFIKVELKRSVAKGTAIKLAHRLEVLCGKFKPKENPLQTFNQILPILRGIHKNHIQSLPPGFNLVIVEMIKEIEKKIKHCPVREEMSVYLQSIISLLQNLSLILRSGNPLPSINFLIQIRLMKKDVDCAKKQTINIEPYKTKLKIKLLELMTYAEREKPEFANELQELYEEVDCMNSNDVEESHKGLEHIESIINTLVITIGEKVSGEEKNEVCTGLEGLDAKLKTIEVILRKLSIANTGGGAVASSGNGIAIAGGTGGIAIGDPMLILVKLQDYVKWVDASDSPEEAKFVANSLNLHIENMLKYGNDEYYLRYMGLLHKFHIIITLKIIVNRGSFPFAGGEEQELILAFRELVNEGLTSLKDPQDFPAFKILMQLCALRGITASDGKDPKIKNLFRKIHTFLEDFKITKKLSNAKSMFMTIWGFLIRLAPFLEVGISNKDFCTKVGSSEYYFELNDKLEHRQAMEACAEMGGHLARPGRKDLEQLIEHAKKNTDLINLYLDATDTIKENFFQYATGKELPGDELWECNEPDNKGGNQHCVVISMYSSNRLLGDIGCESPQQYICQIGESEPDPIPECKTVGEGCYVFDKRKRSWENAVKECKDMGGILASPCGKQLNLLIQHAASHGGRYWIGACDMDKKQKYMYVKGTKMPCGFWAKGEPNQYGGNEPCVEIKGPHKGLNDYGCQADLQFICQFGEDGCDEEKDRKERAENCIKIEDSCYVIEHKETLTWEEAKMEAKLYPSGQLAAPDRNEMIRLIDHLHKLGGRYWIGANDRATEGSYHYDDQDHKMPGGFWAKGEPKGDGADEDCVEICAKKGGLADSACNTELNYIVEIIDESAPPKGSDKPECTKFGSSCFWINQWDELTWEEAKKACERTGGYLASPTCSADTKGLLEALHKIGGKYWTGATDSSKEGEYKYVTGNVMIEGHWVCGEPNQGNCKQEDCIGIWSKMKGFYDETCDARLNYVCQYGEVDKQVPEPKDCHTIGTGCFIIEASMRLDWNAAKAKCESVGAKLAHPTKVQMEGLLAHLQPKGDRWWIGGTDSIREGHWTYANGEHMIGGFWASGEPNNCQNNEHCVEIRACIKKLNDQLCTTKLPYVCQVENTGVVPKPVTEPPEPGCKHEKIGSSCFKIEPDDKLTWTAAQKHCEGLGMTLAAPTDEDLQILLTHMSRIGGRYWIGARDYDASFKFSSGSEIPCLWGPGFPEYKDDQKCVEIYAKHKSLSDGKCESERNFICQDLAN